MKLPRFGGHRRCFCARCPYGQDSSPLCAGVSAPDGRAGACRGIVSRLGARERKAVFSGRFVRWGRGDVAWIVRLVSLGAEGEEHSTDVLQIAKPRDLTDLASLGLTLAEGKRLLVGVQQELVAAQAVCRPECRS